MTDFPSDAPLVIGAGPVGRAVTAHLVDQGEEVIVATRSGSGPEIEGVHLVAVDAGDPEVLRATVGGARVIYCAAHASKYSAAAWRRELPGLERAVMDVAHGWGAPVVFPESLYSMGSPDGVMRESSPREATRGKSGVRAELLRRRAAHPARTISIAASDFFGPFATDSHVGSLVIPKVLSGSTVWVLGATDQKHSFTAVRTLAAAMVVAAERAGELAPDGDRFLLAPTPPAVTMTELVALVAEVADVPVPTVRAIPGWAVKALAPVVPDVREMADILHQWVRPYVVDSSASEAVLGLTPMPLAEELAATVEWARRDVRI